MRQHWHDLLFLHFSVDAAELQGLLPNGLELDTYPNGEGRESAWVGLVLFRMSGIRAPWAPAAPWLSAFCETNVRTYVHRNGQSPGVWFFSLDAARWLACRYARLAFALPYHHAHMVVSRAGDQVSYQSKRFRSDPLAAVDISARLEPSVHQAVPGALEFFLVERYLLYAMKGGKLYTGRVWHRPYQVREANPVAATGFGTESLITAAGIAPRPWESALFSEGVDVEVFGLRPDI